MDKKEKSFYETKKSNLFENSLFVGSALTICFLSLLSIFSYFDYFLLTQKSNQNRINYNKIRRGEDVFINSIKEIENVEEHIFKDKTNMNLFFKSFDYAYKVKKDFDGDGNPDYLILKIEEEYKSKGVIFVYDKTNPKDNSTSPTLEKRVNFPAKKYPSVPDSHKRIKTQRTTYK